MLSQSGSLILSTSSTTNPCTINAQKTDFTFSNINMRNVVGEMWDKYDVFAMKVVSSSIGGTITQISGSTTGVICYNMAGLIWENLHYDTAYMSQQYVPIVVYNAQPVSSNINNVISNTGQSYNFRKSGDLVNLNFTITNVNTTGGPSTFGVITAGNIFNDVTFHFVFEPVIPGEMNECAFFGFNTLSTINTQVGRTVSTDRKEYNYPAFDMSRLCRNFWDKHEDFEIQMAFYNNAGIGTPGGNARVCQIQINGLNFVNSLTKNSNGTDRLGATTESVIIGAMCFANTASAHQAQMNYPLGPIQFKRDGDNVNLTFNLKNHDNSATFAFAFTSINPASTIGFFIKPIYRMEKATLYINPSGLTTSQTNLGIINAASTEFTLSNIDMRQVCRSMWDKYKKFNIFLTGITSQSGASQTTNGSFILQMEGFNFINQTAFITSQSQTQTATLGTVSVGVSGAPTTFGWQSGIVTTFYKTQDLVNLTLKALPLAPATPFSNTPLTVNFTFTIVGVPEDEQEAKELKQNWMR